MRTSVVTSWARLLSSPAPGISHHVASPSRRLRYLNREIGQRVSLDKVSAYAPNADASFGHCGPAAPFRILPSSLPDCHSGASSSQRRVISFVASSNRVRSLFRHFNPSSRFPLLCFTFPLVPLLHHAAPCRTSINDRVKREPSDEPQGRVDSYPQTYYGYDGRREPSGDRQERPRNRWGDDVERETSRERDDRPRNRWRDGRTLEQSRERRERLYDRRYDDLRREHSRERRDRSPDYRDDDRRRERSRDRDDRSRNRLDGDDRRDSRRGSDDHSRNRSRDGFKREPSYEWERRPRGPWGDPDDGPITGRDDSREREDCECSPLTDDDEHADRKDSARSIRRDLTKNYTKENDPYWYPGKV